MADLTREEPAFVSERGMSQGEVVPGDPKGRSGWDQT